MGDVLFLGLGRVGLRTLYLFRELARNSHIYALDKDPSLSSVIRNVDGVEFRTYSEDVVDELASKVDLAVTALPSAVAFRVVERLVNKCIDVVDVSFFPEDPYILNKAVEDCNSVFIPDAGFAPGYSNLVVGYIVKKYRNVESIDIMVGGIPKRPIPPLGYVVTWNPSDLIEEYIRSARIVENGVLRYVDPFDVVVELNLEGIGLLEGFVSDGLRTLIRNIDVRNMREITLRWPGHIESMKLLRDLGLMSKDLIRVGDSYVRPSELLAKLLEDKLSMKINDIAVIYVVAKSSNGRRHSELSVLEGTPESPATSTFTALVHAFTAGLAHSRKVPQGVQPLENLSMFKDEYDAYLKGKGAIIKIESDLE
ncbi:MAG: saccharopine dehydrogenase C-terminal domain-containing protein [Sulfolobales archaeon]|nr:hypothetical protein [Sulfolobales archaeon]MCX8186066.1 hypothetical protein [Sulfolobales archaeon]MDW7969361.1 saccharopine dehydrogenase C-terminal domain-containing protein [Sulfolobales archaeon]